MRRALVAALLLALAGCGNARYQADKPGGTEGQKSADAGACWYQAKLATASLDNALMQRSKTNELTLDCMRTKGYTITKVD